MRGAIAFIVSLGPMCVELAMIVLFDRNVRDLYRAAQEYSTGLCFQIQTSGVGCGGVTPP